MPGSIERDECYTLIDEGYFIFPVFTAGKIWEGKPLCTCGEPGCTGKHPMGQFSKIATINREQVDKWYDPFNSPQPGIAIHLEKSHCWVLDVDGNEGMQELKELTDKYGALPDTRSVISGSGTGRHYYFAGWVDQIHSGILTIIDPETKKNKTPHIHIKGNVGSAYVVVPPTIHHSGNRYEYLRRIPPVDAPEWLLSLIYSKSGTSAGTPISAEEMAIRAGYEIPLTRLLNADQLKKIHKEGNDRYMGYSPVHPSQEPREFSIDIKRNRWTCWMHHSHGGLFELAALLSGLCTCDEFTKPKDGEIKILPLSGSKFKQVIQYCLDLGIDKEDLKKHLSRGYYHG
jgi:hypothetical protein